MKIDSQLVWGFHDDDVLQPWTEIKRPRKLKLGYTTAYQAMGFKPIRVRIIKDADFKRLLRLAHQTSAYQGD